MKKASRIWAEHYKTQHPPIHYPAGTSRPPHKMGQMSIFNRLASREAWVQARLLAQGHKARTWHCFPGPAFMLTPMNLATSKTHHFLGLHWMKECREPSNHIGSQGDQSLKKGSLDKNTGDWGMAVWAHITFRILCVSSLLIYKNLTVYTIFSCYV